MHITLLLEVITDDRILGVEVLELAGEDSCILLFLLSHFLDIGLGLLDIFNSTFRIAPGELNRLV